MRPASAEGNEATINGINEDKNKLNLQTQRKELNKGGQKGN